MSQILTARKNQKLFVGDREEEILLGSILGDASILKKGMIQFEQGSAQKEYLEWKRIQLATIVSGKKIYKTIKKCDILAQTCGERLRRTENRTAGGRRNGRRRTAGTT